jgi:tRNA U34 5-carboxymethylaminomethyl modifying GTPase MnmE/TrmE
MINNEFEIFGNKKFSELLKDIYDNSKKKDRQINLLISELKPLVKSTSDAAMVVPLIKEYLEVGVKNDEHLVKLAAIVQRMASNSSSNNESEFMISDEEKKQLLQAIEEIEDSSKKISVKELPFGDK